MRSEIDAQRMQGYIEEDIPLFEEIAKEKGTKLLHISDTSSFVYPYVKKMIDIIKPDIIIHTGDFVDEVKAGRMINTRDEYECGVENISEIMKNSGAKIYAVCGNNDILEILNKYLPDAEVSMPGNVVNICGIDCLLVHGVTQVTDEAEWTFYGHGLTGETWSPDMNNTKEGRCRFNAIWNFSAFILPERKHYIIKHPEFRK
jgi:predicted phosphodiesterase